MTSILDLLTVDDESWDLTELPATGDKLIPVGYRTRVFLGRGTPMGSQRTEAVRAARNLLGAGIAPDEAAEALYGALERSPQDTARPWTRAEVTRIVADLASKPAPPPQPYSAGEVIVDTPTAQPVTDDGVFRFAFAAERVEIEVSRVVATGRGTLAWVAAKVDGVEAGAAECEIRTAQGVGGMWRFFDGIVEGRPWKRMLEQVRRSVLQARRTGGVVIDLQDVVLEDHPMMAVAPLLLRARLNIVFAAGGSGKSLLAILWGLMVQYGLAHAGMTVIPGNVLYLDWEQGPQDAKRTLCALAAGLGVEEPGYKYVRCDATLAEMGDDLGRRIVEHDISFVVIDSLTFALGGDKNESQTILAGFEALRRWPEGVTIVPLDHVSKADRRTAGGTTIGNVMVENAARNMLRVTAWQDPETGELHQVLRQTKQNKGMLDTFGLKYTFEPDSMSPDVIFVEREDPPFDVEGKMEEESKGGRSAAPQRAKVLAFIKGTGDRLVTKTEVEQGTGVNRNTIKTALEELCKRGEIIEIKHGPGVASTYATRGGGSV